MALAQAGARVTVLEAEATIGGGTRTQELTLPGFQHDVCSAVHPLAAASPFFRSLPLERHGLTWIQPDLPLAHPFDDGTAATLHRSLDETAALLGEDGPAYKRLMQPVADCWDDLAPSILAPVLRFPRHPLLLARFGIPALMPATLLARRLFKQPRTGALFAGIAAHANARLDRPLMSSFGLVLGGVAHVVGWPIPKGGSQAITSALASYLESLGGDVRLNSRVESMRDLPDADAVLFDLTPRQVLSIAGERLSTAYGNKLARFRYGAGVFKLDYALSAPIPWTAPECHRAGTVHLGASLEEIVESERSVARGRAPERPYILVAQQSLFDDTRAPAGQHTAWAYCHVPNGSTEDMTLRVEAQLERFAPGFGKTVLQRHVTSAAALQDYNANYIGGDIAGGANEGLQLLFRPSLGASPYETSDPRLFLCSSSTPPGAGVHGMCGYGAAQAVLRRWRS